MMCPMSLDEFYDRVDKSCPELNLIKDKIPVLGLDIVERRSSYLNILPVLDLLDVGEGEDLEGL